MSSSVTVWTSSSTALCQSRVAQIVSAARVADAAHDTISPTGLSVDAVIESLNKAFNRLVTMTMSDSTLHIVSVIPLYEDDAVNQIQTICDACSLFEHSFTLHILGLAQGISHIFEAKVNTRKEKEAFEKSHILLKDLCRTSSFGLSYSIIDDYAENGAPIGFTIESLSRYIATVQVALMQDYYKILSPAILTAHPGDNLSIGISSLSFNRDSVAQQMLGLGFLEALDNVGINDKEVDAQKAAREAETFLEGITGRYPKLYESSIKPLYKDSGVDEGRVVAKASPILDENLRNLKEEILSLLHKESLSLPEREAVLALILGRDNENLRGMQYEHEGALLDDACEVSIDIYVKAFNRCCNDSDLLPKRGDFEALKKFKWNESTKEFEESAENYEAFNPLHDIKRLKQEIINATSFIRDKQDELVGLQTSVQQRQDAEEIKSKWHKPKGVLKDVEYKEQPLDQQYTPSPGLKIKETVDLRKFFTPVKNQLDLGSCTSFAAVAMYEAMMNMKGVEGVIDMSPAYLYYYSNILNGRPAGGSNFYEQLKVLGTYGVCNQNLYCYDADSPETPPSEQADADAKKHRVIAAKQIPLINEIDKSETIKQNHKILTSALSEGYPVGISLKVYDNLGKGGAFILHPEDAPDAIEEGWHAMVIVGYSEENNFYIVRNSWGHEFGEDGYCYIPSAYIDDPDYMDFACIITEISDGAQGGKGEIPTVLANFAAKETEIRIAAIRNAVAKMRIELKNSQKLYAEYYKYYQKLLNQLTIPKIQNDIRSAAEIAQAIRSINVDERKRLLEDTFVGKLKDYKNYLKKIIIGLSATSIGLGLAAYYSRSIVVFILFLVFAALCVATIGGYKWWKKIKRDRLQEELEKVYVDAKRQEERLLEMQIRFHVAGMWLQRFHKLSIEIGNVYDRLVSYNHILRTWQDSYSRKIGDPEIPEGQMFRVLDASPLLQRFFEQNKSAIIKEVNLIELFDNYKVNPDNIEQSHQQIKDSVTSVINNLMSDFNMANFLLGDEFPYLNQINITEEFAALLNVGQPSYRNRAMNATTPVRLVMTNISPDRENQWINRIVTLFPMRPIILNSSDSTSLTLLTIHPQ
ncbi:MAG: C1 family peptidase [Muribaculaceae bacterium]|nr:C1 family peptidase [Muribaculaceae bacterium]